MSAEQPRRRKRKAQTNFALDLWLIVIGAVLIPVGIFIQYQNYPPHLDGTEDHLDKVLFIAPIILLFGLILLIRDGILWLWRRRH